MCDGFETLRIEVLDHVAVRDAPPAHVMALTVLRDLAALGTAIAESDGVRVDAIQSRHDVSIDAAQVRHVHEAGIVGVAVEEHLDIPHPVGALAVCR